MEATILPGPGHKARASRPRVQGERHNIQSVDRALFLLESIADAGGETTLTDLSQRTGLNISTCHHLLATLVQRGFAAKVAGRLYALGPRILHLGHACRQVDLPRRAQAYLEAVNRATGETVHLAAVQGDAVVTLAVREARHAVRVDTGRIGKIAAPHATSVGKAILAWLPEDEMRRILRAGSSAAREHDHRLQRVAEVAALRAPRRLCDRPRGASARRDLRWRRDPRSGWHRHRRDQRIDADDARER